MTRPEQTGPIKQPIDVEDDAQPVNLTGRRDEPDRDDEQLPEALAVLPVRNTVTFPGVIVPMSIQRETTRQMLAEILPGQKFVLALSQKDPAVEDPAPDDLYQTGTVMAILKLFRMDDGEQSLIIQGISRARVADWNRQADFLQARIEPLVDFVRDDTRTEALAGKVRQMARKVITLSPQIPDEAAEVLSTIDEPGSLADFLAANVQIDLPEKQQLLEETDVQARLESVAGYLQKQIDILEIQDQIQQKVRANVDKSQREYFLNEQLKAIRKELGHEDDSAVLVAQLAEAIDQAHMPEKVHAEASRQLDRLGNIPSASPEHNVLRTYLETLTELPWTIPDEPDELDVNKARAILDKDHYDLDKVKRRIVEYLAVRKLAPESHGPILCFVGPPGVGKTSLGQSIARALGRRFIRMSLGGVRDEAELRGHRRTYIGSMPGRIIQEIRKAGSRNAVFMLDELDKVGADFRGDPTSALLEILDPAQNPTFQDHYLNMPFDLSKVVFIATANVLSGIPAPLRDRMEVISLAGYTPDDKLHIARKYLVPRQRKENGLTAKQIKFPDAMLRRIIEQYTREAGVRELERQIGSVCRSVAALIATGQARSRTIKPKILTDALGPRLYEDELAQRTTQPGVATGLAYTPVGGTILFIEAAIYPGRGQLRLTGQIGDVMKESAQAALSLVKSTAAREGMEVEKLIRQDIHIHVPAGAIPKDGPSAGVAMFTALMSLLTEKPVRPDVAMTGEITLRGLVLPIGGVKEKTLAARRAGIKTVILPKGNQKDLADVPADVRDDLEFVFVSKVDELRDVVFQANKPARKKAARK